MADEFFCASCHRHHAGKPIHSNTTGKAKYCLAGWEKALRGMRRPESAKRASAAKAKAAYLSGHGFVADRFINAATKPLGTPIEDFGAGSARITKGKQVKPYCHGHPTGSKKKYSAADVKQMRWLWETFGRHGMGLITQTDIQKAFDVKHIHNMAAILDGRSYSHVR